MTGLGISIFWLGLALIVGALGRHRNIGFFFAFLWAILLSPIIGLAITLFSAKKVDHESQRSSILNQLEQLSNLKEKGIISDTQFEREKINLLDQFNHPASEGYTSKRNHFMGLLLFFIVLIGIVFGARYYLEQKHKKEDTETQQPITEDIVTDQTTATTSGFGYISGRMYYPSEGIPDFIKLKFENVNTGEIIELDGANVDDDYNYTIKLPVGSYYVFEDGFPPVVTEDENTSAESDKSYYTYSCAGENGKGKKPVLVKPNQTSGNIIPCGEGYE